MRIYNTLGRRVEEIVPLEPGTILMYTCGPTVYRNIHVGNLRTFTMADWLRRALEYRGYRVTQVKNITDVGHMRQEVLDRGEDKMIAQARREGKTSAQIAAHYTESFHRDEAALHILPAHVFPRATDHIPEMLAIVKDLVARDVAYVVEGNVFYDVTRFPAYGALSGNQLAQALERMQDETAGKRHPEDFPLWKRAEPGREMAWDSPWGRGFPGWHIECSAMAIRHLGPQIDLHTGGVDNIFPHHEDEIAQSEAHTGHRFARYWVHAQHLLCDGQKMAKSTGNAYILDDVIRRGFDPLALRYLFAMTHYRARMNFTFSALRAAERGLRRLRLALATLASASPEPGGPDGRDAADRYRAAFLAAIDDDLNLPRALSVVWAILRRAPDIRPGARLALVLDLDRILGLDLQGWLDARRAPAPGADLAEDGSALPREVADLVRERGAARHDRDFARADVLRSEVARQGYAVGDTPSGTVTMRRRPEEGFAVISRSADTPDRTAEPDRYAFSVQLVAHDSRDDLERCIATVLRHRHGRALELVIVDNGSTDATLDYLRHLARTGLVDDEGQPVDVQVFFADHDLGFAAARNAGMRAARGHLIVWLDTAIEVAGDIWTPLERALADPEVGVVGPYALRTDDLKEFYETTGPEADAVEGYLLAFRRALLSEVGMAEEKFRFYRLLDIYMSFMFKTSGYRVRCVQEVADLVVKHPHRVWYSLSPEERATRSKKNFDIFRRRWHHGQSLQVANYVAADRWFGHDHPRHLDGAHTHPPEELPPPGQPHCHDHRHWPDHSHSHPHQHRPLATARG